MLQLQQDPGTGGAGRFMHVEAALPVFPLSPSSPCSTRGDMHGSGREGGRLADGQVHVHVRQAGKKKDIDP